MNLPKHWMVRIGGVRLAAIRHPNATAEHISKALDDEDEDVQYAAVNAYNQRNVGI
jgi:hypothetical protein